MKLEGFPPRSYNDLDSLEALEVFHLPRGFPAIIKCIGEQGHEALGCCSPRPVIKMTVVCVVYILGLGGYAVFGLK
jgi:hypothetical protein